MPRVVVLTEALYARAQVDTGTLEVLYDRLRNKGVEVTPLMSVIGIDGKKVATTDAITGEEGAIEEVDVVAVAYGVQASDTLYRDVQWHASEVRLFGGAIAPRRMMDAIPDGAWVGRQL